MKPVTPDLSDATLLPLDQAARRVGMSRARVRELVEEAGIGVLWSRRKRIVAVQLNQLWRVILAQRVGGGQAHARPARRGALHPGVKC